MFYAANRILAAVPQNMEVGLSLNDPMQTAQQLLVIAAALVDPVKRTALWLGPLLVVCWAIASGLGRNSVLQQLDPALASAPWPLIVLQLLRVTVLAAACLGWYCALHWAAESTLAGPEPNLVAYSAWVICLTLGTFVVWALVSWIFFIAPLLAMLQKTGVLRSLAHSLHLGPLTGKLVEVNLVLGIVRLALIVLAMVFSSIPLPFEAQMSGIALYLWWALVTLLYFVANDFFQLVRLAAFVRFWQFYQASA